MSKILRSFYHNLKEPVIIYDINENLVHCNKAFSKAFMKLDGTSGLDALKKINYKFYCDICLLESEELMSYSPVLAAIFAKSDFTTYALYQLDERKYLYYIIKSFTFKKYKIVYFYDVTKEVELEKLKSENEALKIQNLEFSNTNSKAQNQALKMALLNRISTSIRETLDAKSLIKTALKELSLIFGAHKVYYALECKGKFIIDSAYPSSFLKQAGENVVYDKKILKSIYEGKNSFQFCLKEHNESKEPLKAPLNRIIIPVIKSSEVLGIIVVFTPKKEIGEIEKELLVGISGQISSAIFQAILFNQVTKKKEELESAIKELKETQLQLINAEKMASLGQLIASVAHEINTPLASISANNEIAKKIYASGGFDEQNTDVLRDLNSIDSEAIKRISNLVCSLKRFVRLDEMVQQEADINQELDLTLDLLKHKTKKGINIVKKYEDIPLVKCYPNMLNQVFLNILMNAIQSVEKKTLKIGEYGAGIEIATKADGGKLCVSIKDNGLGIEEKNKKKIFQAGFTTKKVGEGTGLGLAICKKIIEKHKGEIFFESKRQDKTKPAAAYCTEFCVVIPIN